MTRADRVLSTPTTSAPTSRRRFLSAAVTPTAGSAALALAIPPALAADEPVYALIEKHKTMTAALFATLDEKGRLEDADLLFDESLAVAAHDAEDAALMELVERIRQRSEAFRLDGLHHRGGASGLLHVLRGGVVPLLSNPCEALKSLSDQKRGSDAAR